MATTSILHARQDWIVFGKEKCSVMRIQFPVITTHENTDACSVISFMVEPLSFRHDFMVAHKC